MMKSQRTRALRRVLGLGLVLGALFLAAPAPAQACEGGGGYYECRSYWFDQVFYPCLATDCAGLSGHDYMVCHQACWDAWIQVSRDDCDGCPA
jgi:hypothetical protein